MEYKVFGPFQMQRLNGQIDKSSNAKRHLWESVEAKSAGLSSAVGCYVFAIGAKAWYVGLAERQPFRKECFAVHKLLAYNSALGKVQGKPSLFSSRSERPLGTTRRRQKPSPR